MPGCVPPLHCSKIICSIPPHRQTIACHQLSELCPCSCASPNTSRCPHANHTPAPLLITTQHLNKHPDTDPASSSSSHTSTNLCRQLATLSDLLTCKETKKNHHCTLAALCSCLSRSTPSPPKQPPHPHDASTRTRCTRSIPPSLLQLQPQPAAAVAHNPSGPVAAATSITCHTTCPQCNGRCCHTTCHFRSGRLPPPL